MSLKQIIFKEICGNIFDPLYVEGTWRVLVLDDLATRIVSSIMKMSDIFDRGITHVDDLFKKREPMPMEAIYIMSSNNNKSLHSLINDFLDTPTYRGAHVYFTDEINNDQMGILGKSIAANYVLTLKETSIQYLIKESQLFTLIDNYDSHSSVKPTNTAESPPWVVSEHKLKIWARSLASLCETLNECPNIHYQNTDRSKHFASYLQKEIDSKILNNPSLGQAIHRDKSIVLILDRSFDPITPLLHDLHLQSIAYDLISIEGDTYTYKNLETEKICNFVLSEDDSMWKQLRHMHMADVSRFLPNKLKQLANAQKCLDNNLQQPPDSARSNDTTITASTTVSDTTSGGNNAMMTRQLGYLMKKMPHIRQEVISVSSMFHLSEACLKAYQYGLSQLCECEQNLAIGSDASGDSIKNHDKLVGNALNGVMTTMYEKIRLLLILLLSQNSTSDLAIMDLIQKFQINDKIFKIIRGLCDMGQFLTNSEIPKIIPSKCFYLMNLRKQLVDLSSYTVSRWTPFIKDLMEDCISGRQIPDNLIKTNPPSLHDDSSLTKTSPAGLDCESIKMDHLNPFDYSANRREGGNQFIKRHSWSAFTSVGGTDEENTESGNSGSGDTHVGPRLILFVIGGVVYPETKQAYDITKACREMKASGCSAATNRGDEASNSFALSIGGSLLRLSKNTKDQCATYSGTGSANRRLENGGGRGWHWEVLIGSNALLTPESYLNYLAKSNC